MLLIEFGSPRGYPHPEGEEPFTEGERATLWEVLRQGYERVHTLYRCIYVSEALTYRQVHGKDPLKDIVLDGVFYTTKQGLKNLEERNDTKMPMTNPNKRVRFAECLEEEFLRGTGIHRRLQRRYRRSMATVQRAVFEFWR